MVSSPSAIRRRSSRRVTSAKRTIAVVTVGRSDFGLYEPMLELIRADAALVLRLMPTGAHYMPTFGMTVREIAEKGYDYERGLEMFFDCPTPEALSKSLGVGVSAFSQAFANRRPDVLMVLGDRMEMLCAPVAALPHRIPVAHIHGGKVTEGALDELARHAITKLSHLHFVSCEPYANRVRQLGEEPWRVHNVGAMGLNSLRRHVKSSREALYAQLRLDTAKPFLIVTYHPVTQEEDAVPRQIDALLAALDRHRDHQLVFTYPNADLGHKVIIERYHALEAQQPDRVRVLRNAGSQLYFDMMSWAAAMIGNSSSGIVEAPSFRLPVVDVGSRQAGAVRAANVVNVGNAEREIGAGLTRALSKEFRALLAAIENPYGDGRAAERIVEILRTIDIDDRLLRKRFVDLLAR